MSENLQKVDHAALRINQYTIIILNILAFVFNLPWLAGCCGAGDDPGDRAEDPRLWLHLPLRPEARRPGQAGCADG